MKRQLRHDRVVCPICGSGDSVHRDGLESGTWICMDCETVFDSTEGFLSWMFDTHDEPDADPDPSPDDEDDEDG